MSCKKIRREKYMDVNFISAANGLTSTYLTRETVSKIAETMDLDSNVKESFGRQFEEAYSSLTATKMLSANMRESYAATHQQDDFREHAMRLSYSIDNRVIDMLHLQLSDDMTAKVNSAMNNALNSLTDN